ncbi:MAG: hypothetical protein ACD_11C00004G0007 [uncultured bacterium]|nr:MAG: hypothetical protein ACD_11C00004G0007 [uncultured bacterium]HBR72121.1 hypothetical protein [Candidatus Moranbacteria bacterium]
MNDITNSPERMEEKFFEEQVKIEKEFEKIELVAEKITEKYKEYQSLQSFVLYLKGMEKVFAQAKLSNWKDTKTKEELIKTEMHFFSMDSGVDEDIFLTIRDDFGMVYTTVKQVYEATEKLLEKYAACAECKEFIEYMKKISLLFIEAKKENWDTQIIKENLYKYRMKKLSADGDPRLEVLEDVRMEFERELSKSV